MVWVFKLVVLSITALQLLLLNRIKPKEFLKIIDQSNSKAFDVTDLQLTKDKSNSFFIENFDSKPKTLTALPQLEQSKIIKGETQNRHTSNTLSTKNSKNRKNVFLLLKEQRELNKKLKIIISISLFTIMIMSFLIGVLLLRLHKKNKLHQPYHEPLTIEQSSISSTEVSLNTKKESIENTLNVPQRHISHIITKLDEFEHQKQYLEQGLSVQSLAETIKTNVKYLSLVINHFKNKTFTAYINELRITYTLQKIEENPKFRKYTIKAIAIEMGFSNAETFSNAFIKHVGIRPSLFIRSLKK